MLYLSGREPHVYDAQQEHLEAKMEALKQHNHLLRAELNRVRGVMQPVGWTIGMLMSTLML